ncbi:hypothetical protein NDU88_007491 [Pleurodeles waltl]|uniref:Uncharacterized protein n=1 Tax=Pleurodeles waltl TaxID=8319 RepID=A0AAV7SSJ0_PLEWA|nr:hypothetical protein NDU88_007491 [Pleurodeles waltl]
MSTVFQTRTYWHLCTMVNQHVGIVVADNSHWLRVECRRRGQGKLLHGAPVMHGRVHGVAHPKEPWPFSISAVLGERQSWHELRQEFKAYAQN